MQAIRVHEFGDPNVLRLEQVDDPSPGAGEVLVRIKAAGINPVDTYVRSGAYERLPGLPFIPGGDGAGIVQAVGEGVSRYAPGDRVYVAGAVGGSLTGCCAELAVKKEAQVFPLPGHISFEQGAAVGVPYATAYRALVLKAEPEAGELLLVHGASGGVGIAAVQLGVSLGLRVAGTAGSERGRELVRQQGAELVLDHRAAGYLDALTGWSGGRGIDVILEMAAHVNLDKDLGIAARGGRIVVVGCRGAVEIEPRLALVKDLTVRGLSLSNASPDEMHAIHTELVAGLESQELQPVVGHVFPLREAARAHGLVAAGGAAYGKIVLGI